VDERREPVEIALGGGRRRRVAGIGRRRRDIALRSGDHGPAVARALVSTAAIDAQQVAGLVLLRLDAEHAFLPPAEHLGEGRGAQALPVLEVVTLVQLQRRVVVHHHARRAFLPGRQRARALALERGDLEQPGLEGLVDLLLDLLLQRGLVGSTRARCQQQQKPEMFHGPNPNSGRASEAWMTSAFRISMKNAPTIGTMRKASAEAPCRTVTAFMMASAQAVEDRPKPIWPPEITA